MKVSSILLYPYWKLKRPWTDHVKQFEYLVRTVPYRAYPTPLQPACAAMPLSLISSFASHPPRHTMLLIMLTPRAGLGYTAQARHPPN